mmetsp:Transcript_41360/g.113799  ORF Transcript_41360/g.113799 Transcript_41360/m.113799 type:complete len:399 (+) Transcript_41360:594-1790(+)
MDGVEPGVLGERVRHDLERLRKLAHAVLHHALERVRPLAQRVRQLHLRRAAAWREESLLYEAAQHAERVVEGALALVEDELVGGLAEEGDGLARVGHPRHLDDLAIARRALFHQVGAPKLLRMEGVDVRDGQAAARLADKLNVLALDVLDDENLHLGEEVEREFVHRVAQDRLLYEEHVAPRLGDLLAHVQDVLALLLEDPVHLRVVRDDDVLLDVRLGRREAKLDQPNLGVLHLGGSAGGVRDLLGEDQARHQLGVVDRAAQLLHDRDVAQVYVGRGRRVDDREHRVDCERREQPRVVRDDLRVERGGSGLDELFAVGQIERHRHVLEDLLRLARGQEEALRDDGGVDALLEQDVRSVQQRAGDDGDRRRAVARLNVLRLGQVDKHLGSRVRDLHLL